MHVTGVHNGDMPIQITKFMESLSKTFFNDVPLSITYQDNKINRLSITDEIISKKNALKQLS